MGRLDDETVIVTGASRGLGASMAKRFAREGATTVVNYPCLLARCRGLVEAGASCFDDVVRLRLTAC
uniref:SDR family NAD(P)-dependent oxidoreductase n=1 Tax=Natronomonas sp. LN261 TaxID=2750669 RepID=UPI002103A876